MAGDADAGEVLPQPSQVQGCRQAARALERCLLGQSCQPSGSPTIGILHGAAWLPEHVPASCCLVLAATDMPTEKRRQQLACLT